MKFNKGFFLAFAFICFIGSSHLLAGDTGVEPTATETTTDTNVLFLQNILNPNSVGRAKLNIQTATELESLSTDITSLFRGNITSVQNGILKAQADAILSPRVTDRLEQLKSRNSRVSTDAVFLNEVTRLQSVIIKIVELKKFISERSDLSKYSLRDLRLLNKAIELSIDGVLGELEPKIDIQVQESKRFEIGAQKIRRNFVEVGLGYNPNLSNSEKWINEYLGRDRNASVRVTAATAINSILLQVTKDMDTTRSMNATCAQLFAR